jgi:hypothetical protein
MIDSIDGSNYAADNYYNQGDPDTTYYCSNCDKDTLHTNAHGNNGDSWSTSTCTICGQVE